MQDRQVRFCHSLDPAASFASRRRGTASAEGIGGQEEVAKAEKLMIVLIQHELDKNFV
jgi:hypothetical protein